MADLSLPSSLLRINDIELRVPPKNISILKQDHNATASTLRSQISTSVKSGRRNISIIVDTYFATGHDALHNVEVNAESWINEQLSPLLLQARKCPFVSIENEKIRKEVIGQEIKERRVEASVGTGFTSVESANMAATIKQIDIESKAREPGIFHVRIHMEWFNYLPFSTDFSFKRVEESGDVVATDLPSNQFESFIRSGTLTGESEEGIPRKYINAFSVEDTNDLEIIYKEYRRIDVERLKFDDEVTSLINFDFDKSEEVIAPLRAKDSGFERAVEELRTQGWELEDELQTTDQEPGRILYRYRRFKIRDIDPAKVLNSGRLLVESVRVSLQTKTSTIPLIGHTVPTCQFLGATDGNVSFNLFANAELEDDKEDGEPIGTSNQLSKINSIIELININAVKYRRISKNDCIFIKHPMSRLLKYKGYDEKRLSVLDESTGKIDTFDPNEYLGCIVQNTESHTVEGMPYCSRFSLSLTENYRSKVSNIEQANQGPSNRVYQSSRSLVQKLAQKYQITKDSSTKLFTIPSGTNTSSPDFKVAQKLLSSFNHALSLRDYGTVDEILEDLDLVERRLRDVRKDIQDKYPEGSFVLNSGRSIPTSGKIPDGEINAGTRISSMRPFSSDIINEVVWDLLKITSKAEEGDERFTTYQKDLVEFKGYNLTIDESNYPDMMLPDQTIQPDFFFFNASDQRDNKFKRKVLGKVRERYANVAEQYAEKVSDQAAASQVSDDFIPSPGPPSTAPNLISVGEKTERPEKTEFDKAFVQAPLDGPQQFANIQTAVDDFTDNTYTMRRSMPTFKIYIKENDIGSLSDIDKNRLGRLASTGVWRNFTDLYDLNAIIDIRLVKDKHNPADLLVIRMTNTREDIVNKAYEDSTSTFERQQRVRQRTKPRNGETEDRETKANLNELDEVMLKEGTRIELRLGYEGDPNRLSVEFSGRISQVGGGDIVEVVCQGDGVELVQELKGVGVAEEFTFNSNTQNLISEILHDSPEIQSFGTINAKGITGEIPFLWRGAGGRTTIENIFAPSLFGTWDTFGEKITKWAARGAGVGAFFGVPSSIGGPVGTVIGTAGGIAVGSLIGGTIGIAAGIKDAVFSFFKGSKFVIYEQTIWDVLQELTLRHPGTVCNVVNFDRRSTIFFGYPDQLYFYRGPTFEEAVIMGGDDSLSGTLGLTEKNNQEALIAKTGRHNVSKIYSKKELRKDIKKLERGKATAKTVVLPSGRVIRHQPDDAGLTQAEATKEGEITLSLMKQYRSYHMVTAEHDIIDNGLTVNSDGVFNSIQIVYPEASSDNNSDGSVGFSEYKKTDEIKADDDLNKDFIKRQTLVFHNANKDLDSLDLPGNYAVSALCKSLNNVYKGRIKILGRPGIKPYDIVFVYDSYNSIYGPVEVENVIHTFSYNTGWITEITPNMVVTPTTTTSVVHINAIQRLTHSFYLRNMKLFYAGAIFNNQGQLQNDLENTSLAGETSIIAATNANTAISTAATGVLVQRAAKDGISKFNAGRKLSAAKDVSKLSLVAKGSKFGLGRLFGASLPIVGDLVIDYAVGYYSSWSKFRQPIIFVPVTRNGKPWYTGLYGLNNNTEIDAVKKIGKDIIKKADFFKDYMEDEFPEIFD